MTTTYAYDDANQLATTSVSGSTSTYSYDLNGNRTSVAVTPTTDGRCHRLQRGDADLDRLRDCPASRILDTFGPEYVGFWLGQATERHRELGRFVRPDRISRYSVLGPPGH